MCDAESSLKTGEIIAIATIGGIVAVLAILTAWYLKEKRTIKSLRKLSAENERQLSSYTSELQPVPSVIPNNGDSFAETPSEKNSAGKVPESEANAIE